MKSGFKILLMVCMYVCMISAAVAEEIYLPKIEGNNLIYSYNNDLIFNYGMNPDPAEFIYRPEDTGSQNFILNDDYQRYVKNLEAYIKNHWSWQPKYSVTQPMSAMVIFKVQSDGTFTNIKICKSSGDKKYDDAALAVVQGTAKYKPLPEMSPMPKSINILITFVFPDFIR